jgi:CRISPR/Cas system CSM-associated protein Csm2 small subunit
MTLTGDMDMTDATNPHDDNPSGAASPLEKLTRAQVFARDPENLTHAHLEQVIVEIRKINERNRKARADDAAIAASAAKIKKANTATRKKKAAPTLADNLLDTKL